MDLTRALTYKEKIRVIAAIVIALLIVGLTRPLWYHESSVDQNNSVQVDGTAETTETSGS